MERRKWFTLLIQDQEVSSNAVLGTQKITGHVVVRLLWSGTKVHDPRQDSDIG